MRRKGMPSLHIPPPSVFLSLPSHPLTSLALYHPRSLPSSRPPSPLSLSLVFRLSLTRLFERLSNAGGGHELLCSLCSCISLTLLVYHSRAIRAYSVGASPPIAALFPVPVCFLFFPISSLLSSRPLTALLWYPATLRSPPLHSHFSLAFVSRRERGPAPLPAPRPPLPCLCSVHPSSTRDAH